MKKYILLSVLGLFGLVLVIGGIWFYQKYVISTEMNIPVTEYTNFEYPENPAARSTRIGQYAQRKLTLIKRDETHFDFVLEPTDPRTAKIIFSQAYPFEVKDFLHKILKGRSHSLLTRTNSP